MQNLFEQLKSISGLELRENEPLSRHTGFRTGGCCTMLLIKEEAALVSAVNMLRSAAVPYFVLGRGSNVLAMDEGYDGVVVKYVNDTMEAVGSTITAHAGAPLSAVCLKALAHNLSGLEFAYGIPASVGGAVFMNAGAYGGEIADVLVSVRVLDEQGNIVTMLAKELSLSYRHSVFHTRRGCVIVSAEFKLTEGDATAISAAMDDVMARRMEKQPLELPSCGSTFKRPEGAFAAKLIDDCGLRGVSVGGAQVSEKHCGFVVNKGGATTADILKLCGQIKDTVKSKTGYELEMEVQLLK